MAQVLVNLPNRQAELLLGVIQERSHELGATNEQMVFADLFVNGRERGYTLWTSWRTHPHQVSFAECRNSDDIVVYPFLWGSKTAEKDYREKTRRFGHLQLQEAADFVIAYLNEEDD